MEGLNAIGAQEIPGLILRVPGRVVRFWTRRDVHVYFRRIFHTIVRRIVSPVPKAAAVNCRPGTRATGRKGDACLRTPSTVRGLLCTFSHVASAWSRRR